MSRYTASELRYDVEKSGNCPYFFTRKTMRFFGDTMRNYGVRSKPIKIQESDGNIVECWVLYRRRPVNHGLKADTYFCTSSFQRCRGQIVE